MGGGRGREDGGREGEGDGSGVEVGVARLQVLHGRQTLKERKNEVTRKISKKESDDNISSLTHTQKKHG